MPGQLRKVIIVGAGPAGLLLALRLAQHNIKVTIFEATPSPSEQPRATHYGPPAVYELRRAGVLAEMQKDPDCFRMNRMCWRKLDGTYLSGFDQNDLDQDGKTYEDRTTVLALNKVVKVLGTLVGQCEDAIVKYGHKVLPGVEQDSDKAWVTVQRVADGVEEKHWADYIVGCDGAGSQVRRSLFGDWEFPGYTWDKQIVATNTYYDFSKFGWEDSNFIIHPDHLFMAARISETEQLWRVTYTEVNGLTNEEIQARQATKFKEILPGNPNPEEYKVVLTSPYKIHQRCAPSFRVGRYLLAADAAHLCNPFGGLGLTGGIVDVGGLADCLIGIHQGKTSDKILDEYSRVRIEKYRTIIDPISTENFKRLYDQDADKALEKDEFLKMLKTIEGDIEASRKVQLGSLGILHDFTTDFDGKSSSYEQNTLGSKLEKVDNATVTITPVVN
ncbi:hypothetical protein H072_7554 [Dactylellina haptotyla CBS 200.50]|uniref:FAD-binding domain-containing protein n=1 Tax=Dactylellina haptotyla (strain CBS 200.50) TaxID=1284197 RepID=S8AC59_DACHA|nr:hypothetical protein H072_7554 [Dactylellina haptotyla CBS 200.50]